MKLSNKAEIKKLTNALKTVTKNLKIVTEINKEIKKTLSAIIDIYINVPGSKEEK